MKKKGIDSNGYVFIDLNHKTKVFYRFEQRGVYEKGYPTALHSDNAILKKRTQEKTISFKGQMKYVDVRGALAKNSEFTFDEDGNYKFKDYYLTLFSVDIKGEIFGEVSFMDGEEYEDEEGKSVKRPPEVTIDVFIPTKVFDIFEKKYLENDKEFFKKISFSFGIFYDLKSNQKKLGKGVVASQNIHQVFAIPITNFSISY